MSPRDMLNAILSALIAPPCAVCGCVLDVPLDGAVCDSCWHAIAPHSSCFALPAIANARAIGPYEGPLRDVVHALKYQGRRSIAPRLSAMMATHGRDVLVGADLVVPVPLHPRRHRERGFNQAEDLTRHLGVPMRRALRRIKPTQPQVDLPAEQRRENVRGAFAIRRTIGWSGIARSARGRPARGRSEDRPLQGYTIVLVDDVATTGATLETCARVLMASGAAEVRALTAARVVSGPR